jgi:hypothetical protein
MATGKTQIVNLALTHIGEPPIMDITDRNNSTARAANVIYDATFREIARDHEWNCLKTRIQLSKLAAKADFGFLENQFLLPSDFIRMLRLNGRDIKDVTDPYEIEYSKSAGAQVLLSDADTAKIQYIAEIKDTTQYDDLLVESLAVMLASKLATIIRQDEAKGEALLQRYMRVNLPRARKVDGNERNRSPYDAREMSRSLNSRRSGTLQGSLDADAV